MSTPTDGQWAQFHELATLKARMEQITQNLTTTSLAPLVKTLLKPGDANKRVKTGRVTKKKAKNPTKKAPEGAKVVFRQPGW